MRAMIMLRGALLACAAGAALAQETSREELEQLEWGGADGEARAQLLRASAAALSKEGAALLRARLEADPRDLATRMVLLFHELPELRRARGAQHDPRPHGELVLGLIEQHPRSRLAGSAGLLLYPYKRDGMYTGPAWDAAIELWEALVAARPEEVAIACNAGSFLMADPFLLERDGPRALALLRRARELEPREPRWALKLGAYHVMSRSMTRDAGVRAAAARAGLPHLRAAWDLTEASERDALDLLGRPLSTALASAHFDAGEPQAARTFAARALAGEDPAAPRGDVVYEMNALLGRLALGEDDVEGAARFLLAAGKTPGSAVLGSFGPDLTLARELLARGERATVLAFLESCRTFWRSGEERLADWIRVIRSGADPWR